MEPGYSKTTLGRAKAMRRSPTRAEAALWQLVRGSRLGVKFRRQQPIGPFIADFYCAAVGLILEADGAPHDDNRDADDDRSLWLLRKGYRVVRFRNEQILKRPDVVIQAIVREIESPHPGASRHPSPSRGEGD